MIRVLSILSLAAAIAFYFHFSGYKSMRASLVSGGLVLLALGINWAIEYFRFRGAPAPASRKKATFDWSMHYFRAFAITAILLLHLLPAIQHKKIGGVLFNCATVYFLFISGYLCQYLYDKRPSTPWEYYKKKIQNVITPYLVCSTVSLFVIWFFGQDRYHVADLSMLAADKLWRCYLLGLAQGQYWYIPFVTILFLLSPLLCRMRSDALIGLFLFTVFMVFMFPDRAWLKSFDPHAIFHIYVYFTWSYIAGFLYSRHRETLNAWFRKYIWLFAAIAVIATAWQFNMHLLGLKTVNLHFVRTLQKIGIIPLALLALLHLKNVKIAVLDKIADYSFTMYFIHMFFVEDFVRIHGRIDSGWIDLLLVIVYLALNLGLSILMKTAIGRNSRYFIGS